MTSAGFKVLVTDPIDREGLKSLENHVGIELRVELRPSPEALSRFVEEINAWLVRSETRITGEWIARARSLKLIGRAGVGVDNIDLETASRRGIAVINAPQANTVAACEHTWGLILALARNIPQADADMKLGGWDRSRWMGAELAGKTLGIVGLGRVGREVAKRALAFGMRVLAHDPYISLEQAKGAGAELVDFRGLLGRSDYVTLHVPLSDQTRALINAETARWIKPGARLVNCARGELTPEPVLRELLVGGRLRGAALDVFEKEPLPAGSPLRSLPRLLLTPHLGASTEEAQRRVAEELSRGVIEFYETGLTRHAINMPGFDADTIERLAPYLDLSESLGAFLGQTLDSGLRELRCRFQGDFQPRQRHPIAVAALKGILSPILAQSIGYVNAPILAAERGVKTAEASEPNSPAGFPRLLTVCAVTDKGESTVSGALLSDGQPRIVRVGELYVDFPPRGKMIVITNSDRPGMIGRVGGLLGGRGVNIADMRVGRKAPQGEAVMVILVDDDLPAETIRELSTIDGIQGVRWVKL